VAYGTGLEAILCLRVLNGAPPFEGFERGQELSRAMTRGLAASVLKALRRLRTPQGDAWGALLGMAASHDPPHDLESVLARFNAGGAEEFKAALVASLKQLGGGGDRSELRPVERIPATELRSLVITALRDLPTSVFDGAANVELLERNAAEAGRLLADSMVIEPAIERLTRGLSYRAEPGVSTVVLVPSLVHRPWTLVVHGDRKIFCYPARLDAELGAPDVGLVAIYRALGDGTRLRILRRLVAGPASVARVSEQLGLAKSTVHEHLESLRSAGLVQLPDSGGFELVPELPDLNWMLKEFLGLEMRGQCERCGSKLDADGVAYICSYECTFCESCARAHDLTCPNCAGELVLRPRRTKRVNGSHHRRTHRAARHGSSP
jgi:biotin operon repressor